MSTTHVPVALFRLGKIVITLNAREVVTSEDITAAIGRHQAGDWGEMDEIDKAANNQALISGGQLVSAYRPQGVRFFLITEADRSVTTVLLPEDR